MGWMFFQAEDGIRDIGVTGVQTCALPICALHPGPVDVEVRHQADRPRADLADQDALRLGGLGEQRRLDRKSVVSGKSVDLGGRRIIKKQNGLLPDGSSSSSFRIPVL